MLFDLLNRYDFDGVYISDTNEELINTYLIIKNNLTDLLERLSCLQNEFLPLNTEGRKTFYYSKRGEFNSLKMNGGINTNLQKAALFIFLNRTCFNGLFRVNSKGLFNVPMGAYKRPMIYDEGNLKNISAALSDITIHCGDYRDSLNFRLCYEIIVIHERVFAHMLKFLSIL